MGKDKGIMPAAHGAAASPGAGYRAGEAGQSGGRLALWAPNASCPPQLLQRAKKTEAKLGSSCSSIKQFRVGFPPSFGGGGAAGPPWDPCVSQSTPSPHTALYQERPLPRGTLCSLSGGAASPLSPGTSPHQNAAAPHVGGSVSWAGL